MTHNLQYRFYGWGTSRKKYDPEKCCKEVRDRAGWRSHQCNRKRGHGPKGLYCKTHAKGLGG